ncbi:MAG: hypothetical protein QM647_13120 [Asticcacaulis sp.]|uniref:hypothetical protein n=1 Tax=Asticcacaulis sp. TaxID=1872648 RepID=UPI0039E2A9B3
MTDTSLTAGFTASLANPTPNYVIQGFGKLKWNGSQYEFEGDPQESAKVFAEHLLRVVNDGPAPQEAVPVAFVAPGTLQTLLDMQRHGSIDAKDIRVFHRRTVAMSEPIYTRPAPDINKELVTRSDWEGAQHALAYLEVEAIGNGTDEAVENAMLVRKVLNAIRPPEISRAKGMG